MRLAKIFLVAVIIVGIVFSSFGQFSVPQKAKAVLPPTPDDSFTVKLSFTDTTYQKIILSYKEGSKVSEIPFIYKQTIVKADEAITPQNFATAGANKMNAAGIVAPLISFQDTTNGSSAQLVVGINSAGKYVNVGLYFYHLGWTLYGQYSPGLHDLAGYIDSALFNSEIKVVSVSETSCAAITSSWSSLLGKLKPLLEKKPTENITYWEKTSGSSTSRFVVSNDVITMIANADFKPGVSPALLTALNSNWTADQMQYWLTLAGNDTAREIQPLVQELIQNTTSIINSSSGLWPTSCAAPKIIDANFAASNSQSFQTPDAFLKFLKTLEPIFGKDNVTTETDRGTPESCGNIFQMNSGGIFNVLLCELGRMAHAAASWSMGKATQYLIDTIGLKFKKPVEDLSAGQVGDTAVNQQTTGNPAIDASLNNLVPDTQSQYKFFTIVATDTGFYPNDSSRPIPSNLACGGDAIHLKISGIPTDAKSIYLLMRDDDASTLNWTVYNLPVNKDPLEFTTANPPGTVGNSYIKPCPSSGQHKFAFIAYVLKTSATNYSSISPSDVMAVSELDFYAKQ